MEKRVEKLFLISIFFVMFLVLNVNVKAWDWDTNTINEQLIYIDYAWTNCGWTQHPSSSDCYLYIPGAGHIKQYSDICDDYSFWEVNIDGCALWYERRACWRIYVKEDKNLKNSYFTVFNDGTNLNCEEKCEQEFGALNTVCVGIGSDINNRNMKYYYYTGGYPTFPIYKSGNCNTEMISQSTYGTPYQTNCYCLKCQTGYRDCDNAPHNGCEKVCCDPGQNCDTNSDCCSGSECSSGTCIPSSTENQCASTYSDWFRAELLYDSYNQVWYHEECTGEWENYTGCVRDTDGNGFFDTKCCPVWNSYFNMVVYIEPANLYMPCREMM